jgi:hypothetical protein
VEGVLKNINEVIFLVDSSAEIILGHGSLVGA